MDITFANGITDSFDEKKRDGIYTWTKGDKEAEPSIQEKLRQQRIDALLTEKSASRSPACWEFECPGTPIVWVREIQFDLKEERAGINQHVVSSNYIGPVPGFCIAHSASPAKLAEAVYYDRPEMQFGLRPSRWWVIFTDGTKMGGSCNSLALQYLPKVQEEYFSTTRNS